MEQERENISLLMIWFHAALLFLPALILLLKSELEELARFGYRDARHRRRVWRHQHA